MRREGVGCSRRERLELTVTALVPAALGLLRPIIMLGGRLSWLAPAVALPLGACLCRAWGRLGEQDLQSGLERGFGSFLGKTAVLAYLVWGLVLLTDSARRYSDRLLTVFEGESVRWLFLLSALGVTLWLSRREGGTFARTGRIFFLAVGAALCGILALALPGVDWKNLLPPEPGEWRGLPGAGALCLSLAGHGVYALCLPRREEEKAERTWPWAAWGCGALSLLLLVVLGAFGPPLVERMEEPFLYLLEGVQVPGAFRRGEAALIAVLALGDLALLALLARGCRSLWLGAAPACRGRGGWLLVAAAVLGSGFLPEENLKLLAGGNLIFGVLLPGLAVLTQGIKTIFSGKTKVPKADVAAKWKEKKSCEENEKKC